MTDKQNEDFFEEGKEPGETQEPETVKVGEKEYTQEELSKLVGLGETASELESKWNTKISSLYPDYTKKSQKLAEIEEKLAREAEAKEAELAKKTEAGEQLSPEEQAAAIKQELKKYGVITQEDVNQYIHNYVAGQQLRTDIESIMDESKETGKPTLTVDELLNYMSENGIKNPEKAYKLRFEKELDEWKESQLGKIKSEGLVTESSSAAGGKEPAPLKVTKENLGELLKNAFGES